MSGATNIEMVATIRMKKIAREVAAGFSLRCKGGKVSRCTSKGSYIDEKLSKRVEEMDRTGQKQPVKTWARVSVIPPMFVGHAFLVSAGKKFVSIFVTEDMVGHKL